MRPRIERNLFSLKITNVILASGVLCLSALSTFASSNVLIRPDVSRAHRDELVNRLRVITGLTDLRFESDGSLRWDGAQSSRGSESARALLARAAEARTS